MPHLEFKGKYSVYSHHLTVPHHPLVPDPARSVGPMPDDDNLIVHGDNLLALKALLPRYAERVKCVYIDPPYNTGNEKWAYNDNVNSPQIRAWLNAVVDREDLERHDKWLCMMWPRLHLLRGLLADDGVIFVSIDDNEAAHLRMLMDNEDSAPTMVFNIHYHPGTGEFRFTDIDSAQRHEGFALIPPKRNNDGAHLYHVWRWSREKIANESYNLHIEKHGESYRIYTKIRDFTSTALKDLVTNISSSDNMLGKLGVQFPTPKPVDLLKVLVGSVASDDDLVLDSFAGSGTTAHAVLALNKEDAGARRFILVECEDYADATTAERVRRVIRGVPGARDAALRDGLGGSFTYMELGEAIGLEEMIRGEALPSYESLAAYLLYAATGASAGSGRLAPPDDLGLFHQTEKVNYHLLWKPDEEWLRSVDAVLNSERAERVGARCRAEGRKAVVFAPAKYIGQRDLSDLGITFCQLPYDLHREG